jgi:antitoxin component YwqK of YwqJK toxin-antitoxin module
MIGYKIAKNGEKRVVVTLEIPRDALTNMNRSSIAVRDTAKYRANKAKVLKIEDDEGNCYQAATSFSYDKKSLDYKVGELLEESTYNVDPEQVCAEGIHYFLSRRVAELYGLNNLVNGLFECWYDNGQKYEEVPYVDGKRNGLYQGWYSNGQKWDEYVYVDGVKHGLYQNWYENGQICQEVTFVDGNRHGLFQRWGEDGTKLEEATYVNGVRQ